MIQVFPIPNIPIITSEKQFWDSLLSGLTDLVEDHDILVCAHTPWSRIRGPIYEIQKIQPSARAHTLAEQLNKDPRNVEVVLRESVNIVKVGRGVIISENKAGVVCANAGVDQSNAGIGKAIGVPEDPDALAREIRQFVKGKLGKDIAVIVSDTVGRALRRGAVNIAIGCAGIEPIRDEIGKQDLFGYTMRVSQVAHIDEIAAAAELVQGQTNEGTPCVIVRGYRFLPSEENARLLNRPEEERLFK